MPELPEVETVRAGLESARLRGRVCGLWRSRLHLRSGAHWARRLEKLGRLRGAKAGAISRRGKYLLWHFDDGPKGEWSLLIHLGMTGQCTIARQSDARAAHTHLALDFDDGRSFRFVDPRRFGALRCDRVQGLHAARPLSELGPEPLGPDFDGAALEGRLGTSTRILRDGLLDQRAVAGIGNIYASEICHVVGIDPRAECRRLGPSAWARVAHATREILSQAITRGGTTLRDYRQVDGSTGTNQDALRVYGREGQACVRCSKDARSAFDPEKAPKIRSISHQGRSLYWCPNCQPKSRRRWLD